MRLDKFLKVSRLIKRRALAKEVCDQGLVTVNGRPAKAGTPVNPGDIVRVQLGSRNLYFEVLRLDEHVPAGSAADLYRPLYNGKVSGPG
ncbi:MAG: RNA-binding S4 domain-containing protein [Bacillota bacterium]